MTQEIIVGVIVFVAACYAAWRLMPASLRHGLAHSLGSHGRQLGLSDTQALKLERKLESSGGCGSCDSCKACGSTDKSAQNPK